MNSYHSRAVAKIIGIPTRVIDYWDRTNFIKPSVSEASGYGSLRLYSFTDLIQLKVAINYRDQRVTFKNLRKNINYLRKYLPDLDGGGYWVECPELPGCSSQGDSIEETLDMIKDAIEGHLQIEEELKKERATKQKAA